ncbi:hypothetical protein FBEOM_10954 [Fusarium beomiforme]|uniref:Uncharacterized protein n=1 Tax=Fusarium beomiforme TaxID=44412 RepID=A0A9P5AAE1_9HYPO|nr:hypothetical protein FBEOM_10954 [Fusarium beomiforme]
MVRILSIATVLLASAFAVEAAQFCQCLYQDGSHCCVYSRLIHQDPEIGDLNCQNACMDAHSIDRPKTPNADGQPGTACNAGGKYVPVSGWNAQFRTPCYKQ